MDVEQRDQQPLHPENLEMRPDEKSERSKEVRGQMLYAAKTATRGFIKPLWLALKSFAVIMAISYVVSYLLFR